MEAAAVRARTRIRPLGPSLLAVVLAAGGCAPALDWREVRPAGSGVAAMFPCKPAGQARLVQLAQRTVRLELHACTAGGATWALAFADLDDPSRVGPALDELRTAAAANLGAPMDAGEALRVPGATPNPSSVRIALQGRAPDGRSLGERVGLFAKGLRVYQATVLGEHIDAEAAGTFFGSLRLTP